MKLKKLAISIIMFVTVLSFSFFNILSSAFDVSASSIQGTTQVYVELSEMYRDDNEIHFTLKDNLPLKEITYEYTHVVNGIVESDLVSIEPKKEDTQSYYFDITSETIGVKIWKVKYREAENYYRNKYTTGINQVGDITSVKKKNYITVTADKLVAYEYNSKEAIELPWYLWSTYGIAIQAGDYLFNKEKSASYTWYFSVDKEMDQIIDVDMEYATFEYTEAFWGLIESKHDYQTHNVTIQEETEVFDYEKFVKVSNEECGGLLEAECNKILKEKGEDYFVRKAIGQSTIEGYDWYVQITLDDLLEGNNVLWGAYENKEYLQEVALLRISYYFEGEYFNVNVLDEDTGIPVIVPDPSPIDRIVDFVEDAIEWISNAIEKVKDFFSNHSWIVWVVIGGILLWILSIFIEPIKVILKIIFFPFTILMIPFNKKREEKKEQKEREQRKQELVEFAQMIALAQNEANISNNAKVDEKKNNKAEKKQQKKIENKYTNKRKKKWS